MPFQSEKQRRFLWASGLRDKDGGHVASRWAHEKGARNKGLPLYDNEETRKAAREDAKRGNKQKAKKATMEKRARAPSLKKLLAAVAAKSSGAKKHVTRANFDSSMFALGGMSSLAALIGTQRHYKSKKKKAASRRLGRALAKKLRRT